MIDLRVCRLCLKDDETVLNARTARDKIIETIRMLTSVQMLQWPMETVYLCDECEEMVIKFDSFRETCLANDEAYCQRIHEKMLKQDDPIKPKVEVIEEKPVPKRKTGRDRTNGKKSNFRQPRKTRFKEKQSGPAKLGAIAETKEEQKNRASNVSDRSLPCTQCGKMIKRRNMNKHMLTHTGGETVKCCSHCGKAFKNMHLLKVHINSHHTFEKKYECSDCGRIYFRPNSLREHVYSKHSTEKRFECGVCGLKFSNFARRQYHYVLEHTVAKPYACQYCDKAFKFKGDLTVHTRTHTGEKPFACNICGKTFSKSYNVVIHKKTHANLLIKTEAAVADSETTPNQNK